MDYLGSSLAKLKKKEILDLIDFSSSYQFQGTQKTKEHAKPYHRSIICKFRLGKTTIGKQPGFPSTNKLGRGKTELGKKHVH